MEAYTNNEGTVNEEAKDLKSEEGTQEHTDPENPGKKNHHSSALYAASMWHSTVGHVKPHSGRDVALPADE